MLAAIHQYVPGWDCHGLPIEWKIEEEYRAKNKDKDQVPVGEFRRECRAFADHRITVQREEFKPDRHRLADPGDRPPLDYEVRVGGGDRQRTRQVPDEWRALQGLQGRAAERGREAALAEAEIEYHDHTSDTVHVRFPVLKVERRQP